MVTAEKPPAKPRFVRIKRTDDDDVGTGEEKGGRGGGWALLGLLGATALQIG